MITLRHGRARLQTARGFFAALSLPPDVEAARALFRLTAAQQRDWGEKRAVGPMSLAPNRLREGVLTADYVYHGLAPRNPPYLAALLQSCGLLVESRFFLYRLPVPDAKLAARVAARFGATAETRTFDREACAALAAVEGMPFDAAARAFGSLGSILCLLARVHGTLAGYLILLHDGGTWRLSSVNVLPEFRRRGAVMALVAEAVHVCPKARFFEAGVIEERNVASRALIERAGGWRVAEILRFALPANYGADDKKTIGCAETARLIQPPKEISVRNAPDRRGLEKY